jgi:alpha-L-fucosidase
MKKFRTFLVIAFAGISAASFAQIDNLPMTEGKYKPTDESLKQYKYPVWFRDAKFGIWSHWGPQAVPRQGDWYARKMYQRGYYDCEKESYRKPNPDYVYHSENYGHQSEFGYKDIIPLWKAERWNPDELMKLYKRVGARYFVSMGTHHDNFFLWNSKLHRWNSVNMGPKKDVVGLWKQAAKREGLYFGVSEHLGASYTWFQTSHGADQIGDRAGVPYDGNNPEYEDLYHAAAAPDDTEWLTKNPVWQRQWYDRIMELIEFYDPDLLYSDSGLPFEDVGRTLIADFYNRDLKSKGDGVVYTCKQVSDGRWVHDCEKWVAEDISLLPWQTDTSIGDWYYRTGQKYTTGTEVIQMLIDIVSKNGNLLLNIVQTPEGDLEQDVMEILETIAVWMQDNSVAIYGTRPWRVYGEGPSVTGEKVKGYFGGLKDVRQYQPSDLRFTLKGKTLYAFCMEHPEGDIHIKSLGLKTETGEKVSSVKMLGSDEKISWSQNDDEVVILKPSKLPDYNTVVFAVKLK